MIRKTHMKNELNTDVKNDRTMIKDLERLCDAHRKLGNLGKLGTVTGVSEDSEFSIWPTCLPGGDDFITDPNEVANSINEYFSSIADDTKKINVKGTSPSVISFFNY